MLIVDTSRAYAQTFFPQLAGRRAQAIYFDTEEATNFLSEFSNEGAEALRLASINAFFDSAV